MNEPKAKRFFKQLKALKKGDFGTVKEIAGQAKKERIRRDYRRLEEESGFRQRRLKLPT